MSAKFEVSSSGDGGTTWTDYYPTDLSTDGVEFIRGHNPMCDRDRGKLTVTVGEEWWEYFLPLSDEDIAALREEFGGSK